MSRPNHFQKITIFGLYIRDSITSFGLYFHETAYIVQCQVYKHSVLTPSTTDNTYIYHQPKDSNRSANKIVVTRLVAMAAEAEPEDTVFYLLGANDRANAIINDLEDGNGPRITIDTPTGKCNSLRIQTSHAKTQYCVAQFGSWEQCDIILPQDFCLRECYIDVNPLSGELLLHSSTDGRVRLYHKEPNRYHPAINNGRNLLQITPDRAGSQCAIVLCPDTLSEPSETLDREYYLEIGRAKFLIRAPIGDGQKSPSEEIVSQRIHYFGAQDWYRHRDSKQDSALVHVKLRRLGYGAQGTVYHVVSVFNGCHFACKVMDVTVFIRTSKVTTTAQYRARLQREVRLVREARSRVCSISPFPYAHIRRRELTGGPLVPGRR